MVVARAEVCVGSHMPGSDLCVEDLRSPRSCATFLRVPTGSIRVVWGLDWGLLFMETTI